MIKWIINVCLCALLFCSELFGMKAFDSLSQNNILRAEFSKLIQSNLGQSLGQPVTSLENADRYTVAVYVTRCTRKLRSSSYQLIDDSKSIDTLLYLLKELKSELNLLNVDATQAILEIESHLSKPIIINSKPVPKKGIIN